MRKWTTVIDALDASDGNSVAGANAEASERRIRGKLAGLYSGSVRLRLTVNHGPVDIRVYYRNAVEEILNHGYWQRAWTMQEFILNQYCSIYDRSGRITKLGLSTFYQNLYFRNSKVRRPALLTYDFRWHASYHRSRWNDPEEIASDDTELLRSMYQLKSQHPSDKVFALKFVYPVLLGDVKVDYDNTAAQTYADAARAIITATKSLDILPLACQKGKS